MVNSGDTVATVASEYSVATRQRTQRTFSLSCCALMTMISAIDFSVKMDKNSTHSLLKMAAITERFLDNLTLFHIKEQQ